MATTLTDVRYAQATVLAQPAAPTKARRKTRKSSVALWTVQGLLAAVFLFAGGMKLAMPIEMLTAAMPFPGWFLRFIAVAEVAGALGLILPGAFRIARGLTPLAALGLVTIMTGATTLTLIAGDPSAILPAVVGILAAVVAYGRRPVAQRTS